ncbi:MAG: hypothetical protein K0R29_99 [Pseudobdellovibrio sp.]|nr:hypothetical protein [Pseudobdellovibrio sp.]
MKTFLFASLLFSLNVLAADYMEIARTRSYKGGPDESDLKVQTVLYQAPNKKKKVQKIEEPSEGF